MKDQSICGRSRGYKGEDRACGGDWPPPVLSVNMDGSMTASVSAMARSTRSAALASYRWPRMQAQLRAQT